MKPYVWISWPIRLVSFLENNRKWKNQISESKKKEIQEQLKGTWAQVKRLKRKSNSTSCQSITESVNEVHSVQFEHVSKGKVLKFMLSYALTQVSHLYKVCEILVYQKGLSDDQNLVLVNHFKEKKKKN